MKVAIIGAGKMGRWFTGFFVEEGESVIVSSRSHGKLLKMRDEFGIEIADIANAVRKADWVLICVSLESFEDVVRVIRPHVRPDQVVMDICSIKAGPVKIMHKHLQTATTLGTHPLFGPGVKNVENQNFVLTPTNTREKRFAEDFRSWLEERGASVSTMSPKKHDKLMSVVLGLPHFLGLVVSDTLLSHPSFPETKKVAGPSYQMLLALAEAVAAEDPGFYAHLQMKLPEVEEIESLLLEKSKEWLKVVRRKDRSAFASKMELVWTKLRASSPETIASV